MPMINKKALAVTLILISSSIAIYAQYVQNNYNYHSYLVLDVVNLLNSVNH